MRKIENKFSKEVEQKVTNIPGWGFDADPENNPTYPMKHYNGADHQRLNYPRVSQQPIEAEILHSNERPEITRVFGTSTPPTGLSGMLRRYAFKFSEGSSAHWLTLLLADRINVVEGIAEDFSRGKIPNIFQEKGLRSEWKFNRKGVIKNIGITVGIVALATTFLIYKNQKNRSHKLAER
jgi:hypothetical protein